MIKRIIIRRNVSIATTKRNDTIRIRKSSVQLKVLDKIYIITKISVIIYNLNEKKSS